MDIVESVSKRTFSGSSGTYNVQALELAAARERSKLKGFNITVRFLDDTEDEFHVGKRCKGSVIMDQVYQHLELVEKDYFGLQYSENGSAPNVNKPELMRWLDPSKPIKKQLNNCQYPLYFRVKFYVSDPSKLQEEYTRYQFCLQIRRDILEGRLVLAPSTAILLASYTVQAELGDYQPEEHGLNYLSSIQLIPGQCEEMEKKIAELHKLHKGQSPAQAEFNFLDHAKRIEMYGVELHKTRDNTNREIQLGVTHMGLVVFQNNIKINTFSWSKIMKISFKRKQFFIQLIRELSEDYDTLLGFNMESYRSSKTLWKACVEHHTFFRLDSPKVKRKFPFSLGSKFTYSGRTEFQTVADVKRRGKLEVNLGDMLRALNLNPTLATVEKLGGTKKKNEKKLKVDEFLPIFSQVKKEKEQGTFEDFLECLKLYDKEENGKMMAAELSHTLLSLGERLSDAETEEVLKDCMDQEDDDGFIPYEPFLKKMMA